MDRSARLVPERPATRAMVRMREELDDPKRRFTLPEAWTCAWGPYTSRSDLLCRCGRERLPTAVVFHDPVNLLPVLLHGRHSNTGNAE